MKTIISLLLVLVISVFSATSISAQEISFTNYKLISGSAGQKGAIYHFASVTKNAFGNAEADCIVKIENITPGVVLKQLNHNSSTNLSTFQPEVEYQSINGPSWIEFSFNFVPHNNTDGAAAFNLPEITTSVSGLNNYGKAHEFAECNLGRNSQVVYETEITQLMVSATANGYLAENKWGKEFNNQSKSRNTEKLSLVNRNISTIRVKIGVNRGNNEWAGNSRYTIELKNSSPDFTKVYMPRIVGFQARMQLDMIELAWSCPRVENIRDITVERSLDGEIFREAGRFKKSDMGSNGLFHFTDEAKNATTMGAVFYRLRTRNMEGEFEYSSVKMVALNKKDDFVKTEISIDPATGATILMTPLGWQQKQIFVEIYNDKGELVKKIADQPEGVQMDLGMSDLAAGAYVVRITCGRQYSTQYLIHSESL
ncbi:hypothetical protein ACFSQD_09270 [Flavihumibacter stibioxidans]|uniref:Secretion system C-terminal sorting domain-containing protein n=1 Tax=Flavihumibacter stibioxidans TaxID=1834163 RepID=A0ABR7M644_9BACT|nr:hypothetical protein [Flavihumibacter stibioxidans]MBC6490503.1 hypothetical protein [Flavihumibacter stibioxidans]